MARIQRTDELVDERFQGILYFVRILLSNHIEMEVALRDGEISTITDAYSNRLTITDMSISNNVLHSAVVKEALAPQMFSCYINDLLER